MTHYFEVRHVILNDIKFTLLANLVNTHFLKSCLQYFKVSDILMLKLGVVLDPLQWN